jgi:hypothetical protein
MLVAVPGELRLGQTFVVMLVMLAWGGDQA